MGSADPAMETTAAAAGVDSRRLRRVAVASFVGTAIEWYDFFLYGTASALVFGKLFFPTGNETASTLASFATFAVGFAARPIGGVLFGHFGDRVGRKATLVACMVVMGLGTFLIGLLPTYASIGIWAPVLLVLLRLVQGIGVGGEWGGAALLAMENAPPGKRGIFSSFPQLGSPIGTIASTGVFALVAQLPDDKFLTWGWRVPFLLSSTLVAVGLLVRARIQETPAFLAARRRRTIVRVPFLELCRTQGREVLLAAGMRFSDNSTYYLATVFAVDYATTRLGIGRGSLLNSILIASLIAIPFILGVGLLAERVGAMRLFLVIAFIGVLYSFVFFGLLSSGVAALAGLAITVMILISDGMFTVEPALFSELFTPEVRYSGVSLGFQLASAFAGGLSPLIATALSAWSGTWWPVAAYVAGMGVVSFGCGLVARPRLAQRRSEAEISGSEVA
jgi:MFS transporter, MHS family, shikimate and dehydroshikimate transport protein